MNLRQKMLQRICLPAAAALFTAGSVLPLWPQAAVHTAEDGEPLACATVSGRNVNAQNYSTYGATVKSALLKTEKGWMRVQGGIAAEAGRFMVEYYDADFVLLDRQFVEQELPVWGGFYAASDGNYYVLTGQTNTEEDNSKQVFNLAQYSTEWQKLGSCWVSGANTTVPFDAGSARFAEHDQKLVIRTAHEMYTSDDGYNHQANVQIAVNLTTLDVIQCKAEVSNEAYGYVSHSFNQFVNYDDGVLSFVDHGDAYPRSILLREENSRTNLDLFTFGDTTAGKNKTGVSVGGFEKSSTHYIVAGNTIDQSDFSGSSTRNIMVMSVPSDNLVQSKIKVSYITQIAEGESSASTPHLVETGTDSYALLWTQGSQISYTFLDGAGEQTAQIYTAEGALSDCVPVCDQGKLVWYTWNNENLTFYQLDLKAPETLQTAEYIAGHDFQPAGELDADGNLLMRCTKCGEEKTISVPSSVSVWMGIVKDDHATLGKDIPVPDAGEMLEIDTLYSSGYEQTETVIEFVSGEEYLKPVTSGAPSSAWYKHFYTAQEQDAEAVSAVLRIYPQYNPAAAQEFTITVRHDYQTAETELPTLTKGGFVTHICSGCGHIWKEELPPLTDLADDAVKVVLTPENAEFDHTAHEPEITVSVTDTESGGEKLLEAEKDYTVQFAKNTDAGTAEVILTAAEGSLRAAGSRTVSFPIAPQNLSGSSVRILKNTAADPELVFAPELEIRDAQNALLTAGTDYTVAYTQEKDGTLTAEITGTGNYQGKVQETVTPQRIDLSGASVSFADEYLAGGGKLPYSGKAQEPAVNVTLGGRTLTAGTDYEVTYENNVHAGNATVTVTGCGAYTGTARARTFGIAPLDLSDSTQFTAELAETKLTYSGRPQEPAVLVYPLGETEPLAASLYTVSYLNNTDAGTGFALVQGTGDYTGSAELEFTIQPLSIDDASVSAALSQTVYTFSGDDCEPECTVQLGSGSNAVTLRAVLDYDTVYSNNRHAGTASLTLIGIGNLTGSRTLEFTIEPKTLTAADLSLAETEMTYNGAEQEPQVLAPAAAGWQKGTDYEVSCADNLHAGKASVIVTGLGDYAGEVTLPFTILSLDITASAKITPEYDSTEYTGAPLTPPVTVTAGTLTLSAADYTAAYSDNIKPGTAAVSLQFSGDYSGTASATFRITQRTVTVLSAVPLSKEYDGSDAAEIPAEGVALSGVIAGEDVTALGCGKFDDANAGTGKTVTPTLFALSGADAENYVLSDALPEMTADITPRKLEITADPQTKYFGEEDPELTYTAKGLLPADVDTALTGALSRAEGEMIGEYAITRGTLSAGDNYEIVFAGGTALTIARKPLEVEVILEQDSFVYDGREHEPQVTVLYGGEVISPDEYMVSYLDAVDAGTARVHVESGAWSGLSFDATEEYTIEPAVVMLIWSETEQIADGSAKKVTVKQVVGDASGELLDQLIISGNDASAPGNYRATASLPDDVTNYVIDPNTAVCEWSIHAWTTMTAATTTEQQTTVTTSAADVTSTADSESETAAVTTETTAVSETTTAEQFTTVTESAETTVETTTETTPATEAGTTESEITTAEQITVTTETETTTAEQITVTTENETTTAEQITVTTETETAAPAESTETAPTETTASEATESTTTEPTDPAPAGGLAGDVNGDGTVSIADAVLLMRCLTELEAPEGIPSASRLDAADLDGDGLLTLLDVRLLLSRAANQ